MAISPKEGIDSRAAATIKAVISDSTGEGVRRGVSNERVVCRISSSSDDRAAEEENFDMIGKYNARNIGLHAVGAFARVFNDDIGGEINRVVVIADAADESVGSGTAVERVVIGIADQRVCLGIAGATNDCRGTSKDESFHAVCEDVIVNVGKNRVGAFVEEFRNNIRGTINDVVIVSRPALHSIISGATIKSVRTALAENRIVALPAVQPIVAKTATEGVVADQTEKKIIGIVADQAVR